MERRSLWLRCAAAATFIAAVLLLAACGGDDDGDEEQAATEASTTAFAAEGEEQASLLLIMDASGSMREPLPEGGTRLEAAKAALREVTSTLPEGTEVGLRVMGGAQGTGCEASELIAPVEPLDAAALDAAIDGFDAGGETPIGLSLEGAGADLPAEGGRAIVLVSDGEDTCAPPDPCDVASELQEQGIEVRIETVGFALGGNEAARTQLTCIAEASGGSFHDVADAEELAQTLGEVSGEVSGACDVPEGTGGEWDGEWKSDYGATSISQSGDEVIGCYGTPTENYMLEGTVSGRTWDGTFTYGSPETSGNFSFRLSEDGDSWVGSWAYGDVEVSADDGYWNGTRVGEEGQ